MGLWSDCVDGGASRRQTGDGVRRVPPIYGSTICPRHHGCSGISTGLDIAIDDYEKHFAEHQVPHSTALHSLLQGRPYLVGSLARINLNQDQLPSVVRDALHDTGMRFPSVNLFHYIVARAAKIYFALLEALRILEKYAEPAASFAEGILCHGSGVGCIEAPRGMLWHRYETDDDGIIPAARIVPPTSQNQARIEQNLRHSLETFGLHRADNELRHFGETVICNYDPCISCATHFLKLTVRRP